MLRDKALETKAEEFVENIKYKGIDIWDLNYISSSDASDNDRESEEEQQESDDDEEEKVVKDKEEPKPSDEESKDKINFMIGNKNSKMAFDNKAIGQGKTVPFVARRLRSVQGKKNQPRITYEYTYSKEPGQEGKMRKYTVVKNKQDRDLPLNLIDFLLLKKKSNYENEVRLNLLRLNDQEDWDRAEKEWDSSEDDNEDAVNNFIWYSTEDPNNYFVMATRDKNLFEKD